MKETIYLETSVVSYYTAKPSRDIIVLAHQEITREWWDRALKKYDAVISEIVIEEARAGDIEAAKKRLAILKRFEHLELNPMVDKMAQIYLDKLKLPMKAFRDAVHLAVASVHSVDYLVTWNCAHIANGEIIKKLMKINTSYGIRTPVICTPEELMPKMKGE
ncbi:MAG: type II toxin-antitoxin system VapC family toxin [Nitrospirae bacterium]|nr:type II toxin-antitoxin system VapC family toxin [Nitrospirota bacterium]